MHVHSKITPKLFAIFSSRDWVYRAFYIRISYLTFLIHKMFLQNLTRQNSYDDQFFKLEYFGFVSLIWNSICFFITVLYVIFIHLDYTSTSSRCWVTLRWIQKSWNLNTRLLQNPSPIFLNFTYIIKSDEIRLTLAKIFRAGIHLRCFLTIFNFILFHDSLIQRKERAVRSFHSTFLLYIITSEKHLINSCIYPKKIFFLRGPNFLTTTVYIYIFTLWFHRVFWNTKGKQTEVVIWFSLVGTFVVRQR